MNEEQRRRCEENRQRALALKAKRDAESRSTTATPTFAKPLSSSTPFNSNASRPHTATGTSGGMSSSFSSSFSSSQPLQPQNRGGMAFPVAKPGVPAPSGVGSSWYAKPGKDTSATVPLPTPSTGKPSVVGQSTLVSRDRFRVEIPYHAQVISIFKTIQGAEYDPKSKKWTIPLSEHGNLLKSVECLRPTVSIGGLPPFVLKALRNAAQMQNKPEPDLSTTIDPVLYRALMPFQRDGVIFGIRRNGRVLIADDMGLGKTIQALGIAHYFFTDWPLLIVCPSSMRYAWRESIWDWLPSIPPGAVCILESSKDDIASNSKVVIITYDLLQKRHEEIKNRRFNVVIVDESHHLKNFKAARTKAALPILQEAKRAILLSGTPALSKPIELHCQLSAVNRFLFTSNEYGIRYCDGRKSNFGWDYSGSSNMEELNVILAETVMIRRLKSDVLKQLPPKLRKLKVLDKTRVKLNNAALRVCAEAYSEALNSKKPESEKRSCMLEFYNETAKVKLPAVCSYISDLVEEGKKFLVFAHHKIVLDGICEYLENAECKYIRIDGHCSSEDRQYCVEQFQSREDIRVAVLSILAANSGITLTAAVLVVFAELYWNPGILTQAEDRAHRIGQEDSVVVEYLLAEGTSDDVMWPMVQKKLDILNKAGLSKDNFQEADVEIGLKMDVEDEIPTTSQVGTRQPQSQGSSQQSKNSDIRNYFPSQEVPAKIAKVDTGPDVAMFEDDDTFLASMDDAL